MLQKFTRLKAGILVRDHVGIHIAKRGVRPVLVAVVERLDDILLEVLRARMGADDRRTIRVANSA